MLLFGSCSALTDKGIENVRVYLEGLGLTCDCCGGKDWDVNSNFDAEGRIVVCCEGCGNVKIFNPNRMSIFDADRAAYLAEYTKNFSAWWATEKSSGAARRDKLVKPDPE